MLDPAKFALFVGISWALIIAPGPDLIYVVTRGMSHGRAAGLVSAAGVIGGILVHTTAAAFGLTLIFQTSALAFLLVKYLGAAYLIYLGLKSWRSAGTLLLPTPAKVVGAWSLFWQGMLSNVFNPKIAMFFLAFLPQFVDKESGSIAVQMVLLGLTFAAFGLCFLLVVGFLAGGIGRWLTRKPSFALYAQRLAGGILIGLGLRLATSRNG